MRCVGRGPRVQVAPLNPVFVFPRLMPFGSSSSSKIMPSVLQSRAVLHGHMTVQTGLRSITSIWFHSDEHSNIQLGVTHLAVLKEFYGIIDCGKITYIGTFRFRGILPFRYFWRCLP
jgi:hypothetical protein